MEIVNKPIEMISFCGTNGDLRPLRFRYEDEAHHPRIVRVREIISSRESQLLGLTSFLYLCRAMVSGKDQLFELRYTVKNHNWVLYRVMS